MTSRANFIESYFRKYFAIMNYRTVIAVVISIIATWLCYRYKLIFNLDLSIISIGVVFPLVFTLGSAFNRREKALEHLGRTKGALSAITYCFSTSKVNEEEKQKINTQIKNVKAELIAFLHSQNADKSKLTAAIHKIQEFILLHRGSLGRGVSMKVFKLMRDVIMGVENSISIKSHGTPKSIRAYCELFIYAFPFFYAPSLISNIHYPDTLPSELMASWDFYTIIVFGLNMVISFFLISLFNIQEQIEDPFDGDGLDDIKLDNYILDY